MPRRRDLLKLGGALALGGAFAVSSHAAPMTPATDLDPMSLVDPELRPFARQMQAYSANAAPLSLKTLPRLRAMLTNSIPAPSTAVPFETRRVPVGRDQPDVLVYIVNAKPGGSRPGILHTHGGGFVAGDAKSALRNAQNVAAALDCTVVTVDYRLAPETRYLGSIEDNYAGLRWLYGHAAELGVDPKRIAVMGESAGGGHAALLAIVARDRGEVPLIFQSLTYPMLDDRTGSTRTPPKHIGTLVWTAGANQFGWRSFLGLEPGRARAPAAAVPARVENLRGLAPAFIGVGSLDLFADEDLEYARRLVAAGVPTEFHLVPGAFHAFDSVEAATVSRRYNSAKLDALRRAFGLPISV